MNPHMNEGSRTNGNPCYLIFTQDLQGGGKSALGAAIQGSDIIGDSMNEGACWFPIDFKPNKFKFKTIC